MNQISLGLEQFGRIRKCLGRDALAAVDKEHAEAWITLPDAKKLLLTLQ